MSVDNKREFLRALDQQVWVEKRLFPARLIVLDQLESSTTSQEFIHGVIDGICKMGEMSVFSAFDDGPYLEMLLDDGLPRLAVEIRKNYSLGSAPPGTVLTQFLSDLNTYGLHEALAYIFDSSRHKVPSSFQQAMLQGYGAIGSLSLNRQDDVRRVLEQRLVGGQSRPSRASYLDRLIAADAALMGGVWGDGLPQTDQTETNGR